MDNSNNSENPRSYQKAVTMTPTESLILDMLTRIIDILELIVEHLNDWFCYVYFEFINYREVWQD